MIGGGRGGRFAPERGVVHELTGPSGLVRLVVTSGPDPRLLGATVVTTGAREIAATLALAVRTGLAVQHLADLAEPGTALAAVTAALATPGGHP
jgi:pyruvate/2-oxoglutarate dehydrogenase complex dihydrolipoamide dehydrogenase (E3) component